MFIKNFFGIHLYKSIKLAAFLMIVATAYRYAFFAGFKPDKLATKEVLQAFYLGAKFDLRVVLLITLPYILFGGLFFKPKSKDSYFFDSSLLSQRVQIFSFLKFDWSFIYSLLIILVSGIYLLDISYFEYLGSRLNASALDFMATPLISLNMMWQSYPIVPGLLIHLAVFFVIYFILKKLIFTGTISSYNRTSAKSWILSRAVFLVIFLLGCYGKIGYYPLRWSEAFFTTNSFISSLSLNPIHYFFDTYSNRSKGYDIDKVRKYYPLVSDYLGVVDKDVLNLGFARTEDPTPIAKFETPPNVVVIIMESMSAHRTGTFGNPLPATPELDSMAESGWSFTRFYTPSEGTARGVFATVTGVPDINKTRTSSRNPFVVEQNTAINSFTGYEKFYFIGGSANWGNIRGILTRNITDLQLYEEGMFDAPRTDVWGLSDYHLFDESAKILQKRKSKQPFFAIIQSASFHRPYTIPEDSGSFQKVDVPSSELKKWGFESLEELNSLRFSDFSLGHFVKSMRNSPEFANTIFIVLGDHGLPENASQNLTPTQIKLHTERFRTPFVVYAPELIKPRKIDTLMSQVDVMPTVAAMSGHSFLNTGLGRNVLSRKHRQGTVMSYVYYQTPHQIFGFKDNFAVTGLPGKLQGMYDLASEGEAENLLEKSPRSAQRMFDLTNGLYETSKYVLYHNKKPK